MTWISRVARFLRSRRLATSLIIAWLGLLLVWIVPFQFYGLPHAQIRAILYEEPFFIWVYAALAMVTVACMWVRVVDAWRRAMRRPSVDAQARLGGAAEPLAGTWDADRALRALARAGFRRRVEGESWVWGVRHPFSPLGTVLSHGGLVVALACAAAWIGAGAPFEGSAIVAEGESFDGTLSSYVETSGATPPAVAFQLLSVEPRFHEDILLFTRLDCTLLAEDGRVHRVRVGSPWYPDAMTQVALEDFGWTAELLGGRDATTVVGPAVYKLQVFPPGSTDYIDVAVEDARYRLKVAVFGDYVERGGEPAVRSFNLVDPRLVISAWRVLSNDQPVRLFDERVVAPGETVRLTERDSIAFTDVGTYGKFRVTRVFPLPVGIGLAVVIAAGFAMRLAFPRTEALVSRAEDGSAELRVRVELYGDAQGAARVRDAWARGGGS